jgi:hypothetical protein
MSVCCGFGPFWWEVGRLGRWAYASFVARELRGVNGRGFVSRGFWQWFGVAELETCGRQNSGRGDSDLA